MNYDYLIFLAIPLAVYAWRMYVSIPNKICKALLKKRNYAYSGGDNGCEVTLLEDNKVFCKLSYDKKIGFESLSVKYGYKLTTFKSAPSCMFNIYGHLEQFHNSRSNEFAQLRSELGPGNIMIGP